MDWIDYQQRALATESASKPALLRPHEWRTLHAVLGLADEAGELAKAVKRSLFYRTELDRDNMIEEAGDVLWYLSLLLDALGVGLDEVQRRNLAKLRQRYGEVGWNRDGALRRDYNAEKEVAKGNATAEREAE